MDQILVKFKAPSRNLKRTFLNCKICVSLFCRLCFRIQIGAHKKNVQDKLDEFQRLACKVITGAWHSAPTSALETLLHLTHPHILIIETEALSVFNRLSRDKDTRSGSNPNHNIYPQFA